MMVMIMKGLYNFLRTDTQRNGMKAWAGTKYNNNDAL